MGSGHEDNRTGAQSATRQRCRARADRYPGWVEVCCQRELHETLGD